MWYKKKMSVSISTFVCLFNEDQQGKTVTGKAEKQKGEGLPLCGVRPMMSEGKRAAAEVKSDEPFTYRNTGEETDKV